MKKVIRQKLMVFLILMLMLYVFGVVGSVAADCPPGECAMDEEVKAKYWLFYWPCRLCKKGPIRPVALPREKPSAGGAGFPIWNMGHIPFMMR